MNNGMIKVGFCVSYDWELLKRSVPIIYDHADVICFTIDKNRRTWSGEPYAFDEDGFRSWLTSVDKDKKIRLHEGVFSDRSLSAIENDNLQRNEMAGILGPGGWHIQVDADEYFLDFPGFKRYLLKLHSNPTGKEKPVNVCCNYLTVIKKLPDGYLLVVNRHGFETAPFATNLPVYHYARRNGHFNHRAPFFVVHESWAREEAELWKKLNSWGHRDDFDLHSYFGLWKILDRFNYRYISNFHPVAPGTWQRLEFIRAADMDEMIRGLKASPVKAPAQWRYLFENSRIIRGLVQRTRFLKGKILKMQ